MDMRVFKLTRVYRHEIDREQARALVASGFDTPAKIKAAKEADLKEVPGVGPATAKKLKARHKKKK